MKYSPETSAYAIRFHSHEQPKRIALHTINGKNDLQPDFLSTYSRMKYSDPSAARSMAEVLLNSMLRDPEIVTLLSEGETIAITGSAYGEVPTAAVNVAKAVADLAEDCGVNVVFFKTSTAGDLAVTNYGAMSAEQRLACLNSFSYWVEMEEQKRIRGKHVVIIDDLNATGTHERRLDVIFRKIAHRANTTAYRDT